MKCAAEGTSLPNERKSKMKSLGFVEVSGVTAAIDALDIMCKSANVSLVTWERKLGGRLVTMVVEGAVSDVTEAVENAKAQCISKVLASNVIARPHSETVRMVELSASRIKGADAEKAVEKVPSEPVKTEKTAPKRTGTRAKNTKKS